VFGRGDPAFNSIKVLAKMTWFKVHDNHVELRICAKPNAKCSALLDISERGVNIALHAKPSQGEANKELISYLAKLLSVPKSQIILKKGERSKYKMVILPLTSKVSIFLKNPSDFMKPKL